MGAPVLNGVNGLGFGAGDIRFGLGEVYGLGLLFSTGLGLVIKLGLESGLTNRVMVKGAICGMGRVGDADLIEALNAQGVRLLDDLVTMDSGIAGRSDQGPKHLNSWNVGQSNWCDFGPTLE
ncbi:hypothetical protein U1Q18_042140 [Sarracenia purpurea var. burkii]